MGLLSKHLTKSKTATVDVPIPRNEHWEREAMLRVAALVRSAAAIVSEGKLQSSGFRGTDTLAIGTIMRLGDSTLWVDQSGFGVWTVELGIDTPGGKALDWQLKIVITEETSGDIAHLVTSEVLTRDGALVNAKPYQQLRDVLESNLPSLQLPPSTAEITVSEGGLSAAVPPLANAEVSGQDTVFLISTALPANVIHERLGLLHFNRVGEDPKGPWLVGLTQTKQAGVMTLRITSSQDVRNELRFDLELPAADLRLARAVAARQARRLAELALALLVHQDESTTLQSFAERIKT